MKEITGEELMNRRTEEQGTDEQMNGGGRVRREKKRTLLGPV